MPQKNVGRVAGRGLWRGSDLALELFEWYGEQGLGPDAPHTIQRAPKLDLKPPPVALSQGPGPRFFCGAGGGPENSKEPGFFQWRAVK